MAGIFERLFDTRTKEQKEQDLEKYQQLIFPHGEKQRNIIFELLAQLFPTINQKYLRMHYIILKEKMMKNAELSFEDAMKSVKKQTVVKVNPSMNRIIKELLEVDITMDESLDYPTGKMLSDIGIK